MTIYYKANAGYLDIVMRDACDGYGDMVAAAIIHNMSLEDMRLRLAKIQEAGA